MARYQEAMLRAILEMAVEGIVTIDERGRVESFNPAAEGIFGYAAAEVIGRNVSMLMPPPYREAHDDYLERYVATGEASIIGVGREVRGRRKDGTEFPMELDVSEVRLADQRIFAGFVRDISERRQAEAALQEGRQQLALFIEHAPAAIAMLDTGMRYLTASRRWLTDYGLPDEPLAGRHHLEVLPDLPAAWLERYRRALAGESIRTEEDLFERADGRRQWLRWEVCPWRHANGEVGGLMVFSEDISRYKRLQHEVLSISESERTRIGHDLHDGLGQHLAAVEFRMLELRQRLAPVAGEHMLAIVEISRLVRQAVEQVRAVAQGLSPVMLEPEGLAHALRLLAHDTARQHKIVCDFVCPSPVPIHDNMVATHLYRIAQEAVHNAIRHGHARNITLSLVAEGGHVLLGVRDNGIGLPEPGPRPEGMGLRLMHYRAGAAGGSLVVQREAAGGTSVVCRLPVVDGTIRRGP